MCGPVPVEDEEAPLVVGENPGDDFVLQLAHGVQSFHDLLVDGIHDAVDHISCADLA